jgi:predicted O-methyltransferase YrrM
VSEPAGPLPPLLERVYASGEVEDREGRRVPARPTGISREDALALVGVARGARATLEVGMAHGLSTLAIASGHDGAHIAVDPFQRTDWRAIGLHNVERAGLADRVTLLERRSDEALPELAAAGERFDLVLIDGLHLYDATLVDFHYADRLVTVGGRVALHDLWMPAVRAALAFVLANRAYEATDEGTDNLVLLRKLGEDERPWDHYVPPPRGPRRLRWRAT